MVDTDAPMSRDGSPGADRRDWRGCLLAPPRPVIAAAAGLFAIDQFVYGQVGGAVLPQAPLDWTGHVLTTLFVVWAARPLVGRREIVAALIASVVIDADHIPGYLGSDILTAGTQRPYTHSLLSVAVLLFLALAKPSWRGWASGAALGVISHLWRDLAEPHGSGVALLWPALARSLSTPTPVYLGSIAVLVVIGLVRARPPAGCRPRPGSLMARPPAGAVPLGSSAVTVIPSASDWAGRRLHFVGIGGAGMSGLALIADALGATVTGSDQAEGSYTARLRERGIESLIGHRAENVPDGAEVVYSTAVPAENPERRAAARELHRADLLAEIASLRRCLAITGTHGKTTTSAMAVQALRAAGMDPSYVIGGELRSTGANAGWGTGEWIVIEADESDRSLLKLDPEIAVLTNAELDHHATYGSLQDLEATFARFMASADHQVVWDRPPLRALCPPQAVTYDALPTLDPEGSRFAWDGIDVRLIGPRGPQRGQRRRRAHRLRAGRSRPRARRGRAGHLRRRAPADGAARSSPVRSGDL